MTRPLDLTLPFLLPDVEEGEAPRMEYEWGRVQDDGRVLIDQESTPLPASVSSLVALYPGQRVLVLRYGRGVVVVGGFQHGPVQIGLGQSADELVRPGQYALREGVFGSSEYGFPTTDGQAGWLDVLGDGEMVGQRYTTWDQQVFIRRRSLSGTWSAWSKVHPVDLPQIPPSPVGPKVPITLNSPWTTHGTVSSWDSPKYQIIGDVVYLRGMVTGGTVGTTSEPITTLPPEARPSHHRIVTAILDGASGDVQITPTGSLYIRDSFTTGWVSLSSISYPL